MQEKIIKKSSRMHIVLTRPLEDCFDLMRKSPNPGEFPFLQLNEKHKEINIITGHWIINKDMIILSGI